MFKHWSKKKKYGAGIGIIVVLLALSLALIANDFSGLRSVVLVQQSFMCTIQGGEYGCGEGCYCVKPAADAGERCTDSDECEGLCLAHERSLNERQASSGIGTINTTVNSADYDSFGTCSDTTNTLGQFITVEDGQVQSHWIVD